MRFNYLVEGSRGFVQDAGNYGIQTVIDSTISQGYSVITTAAELENVQALKSIGPMKRTRLMLLACLLQAI
jgi:hypothetical protein